MCYRYSLTKDKISEYVKTLPGLDDSLFFYHTNAFGYQALPIVTQDKPDEVQLYKWGLIPHWAKTLKDANEIRKLTPNAKAETIWEKPSFRTYIAKHRCLVPASGFFDFHHGADGKKYPYFVTVKDYEYEDQNRGFCFAGIYSHWLDKVTGDQYRTFSIITQEANEMMKFVHNSKMRQPVILHNDLEKLWLDPTLDRDIIDRIILEPYPAEYMRAHLISNLVTRRKADPNVAETLAPVQSTNAEVPDWID